MQLKCSVFQQIISGVTICLPKAVVFLEQHRVARQPQLRAVSLGAGYFQTAYNGSGGKLAWNTRFMGRKNIGKWDHQYCVYQALQLQVIFRVEFNSQE